MQGFKCPCCGTWKFIWFYTRMVCYNCDTHYRLGPMNNNVQEVEWGYTKDDGFFSGWYSMPVSNERIEETLK